MHWETRVKRQFEEVLLGFHSLTAIQNKTLELISPWTFIEKRSACNTRVENGNIYIARIDSLIRPGIRAIGSNDSLHITNTGFELFPFDTLYIIDADSTRITRYKKSLEFDNCQYKIEVDSVFHREIGGLDSLYFSLTAENRLTKSPDGRQFYFYDTLSRYIDTSRYTLKPPGVTFLKSMPSALQQDYTTSYKDWQPGILEDSNGELFQIKNDTLYTLIKDSVIYFDDDFAEVTELHADGKVDIQFAHEKHTYFKQQIIEKSRNPITGEIDYVLLGSIGAWRPQEKSCWGGGIPNGQCHDRLHQKTYWYSGIERNGKF
jgi:hypothetical protein